MDVYDGVLEAGDERLLRLGLSTRQQAAAYLFFYTISFWE
jgi:hypothetical protein